MRWKLFLNIIFFPSDSIPSYVSYRFIPHPNIDRKKMFNGREEIYPHQTFSSGLGHLGKEFYLTAKAIFRDKNWAVVQNRKFQLIPKIAIIYNRIAKTYRQMATRFYITPTSTTPCALELFR